MTPAWPMARTPEGSGFSSATDFRSLAVAEKRESALMGKLRELVDRYMSGGGTVVARDDVPILKPRKEMRYYFTERRG